MAAGIFLLVFRGKGRTAGMGGSARIFLAVFNFTVDDFFSMKIKR